MVISPKSLEYVPGTYAKKRPDAAQLADQYIREWERRRLKMKLAKSTPEQIPPAICFSRKIGAGALEIADFLSKKIGYPVIDRQLLDHVARNKQLSQKTDTQKLLSQIDREQRNFFKKAYGKKDASPYEFDMVINADFITDALGAAEIVAEAFNQKFAAQLNGMPAASMKAV